MTREYKVCFNHYVPVETVWYVVAESSADACDIVRREEGYNRAFADNLVATPED